MTQQKDHSSEKHTTLIKLLDIYSSSNEHYEKLRALADSIKQGNDREAKAVAAAYLSALNAIEGNMDDSYADLDFCANYIKDTQDNEIKANVAMQMVKTRLLLGDHEDVPALLYGIFDFYKDEHDWVMLAKTYYWFFVYYSYSDIQKTKEYSLLFLNAAIKSNDRSLICNAWSKYGTSLRLIKQQQKSETGLYNKELRDSIYYALSKAVEVYETSDSYIPPASYTLALANLSSHFRNDVTEAGHFIYPDSIIYYADKGLRISIEKQDYQVQIAMYISKSDVEADRRNYEEAEKLLKKGFSIVEENVKGNERSISLYLKLHQSLYNLYDMQERYKEAAREMASVVEYKEKSLRNRYIREGKTAEAKFKVKEGEQKLLIEQERQKRQKTTFIWIGLLLLILLVVILILYNARLRYSRQKQKLIQLQMELEKEKAERQALEINRLQKELIVESTQLDKKNETIERIKNKIKKNQLNDDDLKELLLADSITDKSFEDFSKLMQKVHPHFYLKLQEKADQRLTALDLKYCTYIFMDFSSKEIANILHVDPNTVRTTKHRLKLKLKLTKEDDIALYIKKIIH